MRGHRLTEEQKQKIAALGLEGKSAREIEEITGVAKSTAARVVAAAKGKPWGSLSHKKQPHSSGSKPKKSGQNAARAASLYLDHDLDAVMERLRLQWNLPHKGAVLRRAVSLLDTVLEYREKGYKIYLRDCPENERELKIAGC